MAIMKKTKTTIDSCKGCQGYKCRHTCGKGTSLSREKMVTITEKEYNHLLAIKEVLDAWAQARQR